MTLPTQQLSTELSTESTVSDICHHVRGFGGERVLIPGCMGAAVYGVSGCTCDRRRNQKRLEDRVAELERLVADLAARD